MELARRSNTSGLLLLSGFSILWFDRTGWCKTGRPSPDRRATLCGQEAAVPSHSLLGPCEHLTSRWLPCGRGQPSSGRGCERPWSQVSGSGPSRWLPQVDRQVMRLGQEACLICCLPRGPGKQSWIIMVMREPAALCLSQLGSPLLGSALLWQRSNILHDWKGKGARCRKSGPVRPCKWGGKPGGGLPVGEERKFAGEWVI